MGAAWRALLLLQVERELPLLRQGGAAHLHAQAPALGCAAVQAQVAAHVPQLGVALDLLPFLQETGEGLTVIAHTRRKGTDPWAGSPNYMKSKNAKPFFLFWWWGADLGSQQRS